MARTHVTDYSGNSTKCTERFLSSHLRAFSNGQAIPIRHKRNASALSYPSALLSSPPLIQPPSPYLPFPLAHLAAPRRWFLWWSRPDASSRHHLRCCHGASDHRGRGGALRCKQVTASSTPMLAPAIRVYYTRAISGHKCKRQLGRRVAVEIRDRTLKNPPYAHWHCRSCHLNPHLPSVGTCHRLKPVPQSLSCTEASEEVQEATGLPARIDAVLLTAAAATALP